jgi:AraC-like DNA-binding protein
MTQVLTTDVVAPRQRVAFWQEMVSQTFVQAHCDSSIGEAFRGSIRTDTFAQTEISRIDAGPQLIHRRRTDIARACKPRFYLCYHAAGHAVYRERHTENVLGPGDMILLDNCEPYSAEYHGTVTSIVLHVPHGILRDRFRLPERVLGHKLSGAHGLTRIAGDFLKSCVDQADRLSPAQRPAIADMALNLFSGLLAEEMSEASEAGAQQAVVLARIKQYVLAHLGDPSLDLEQVAAVAGISTRQLSRLFQLEGLSFGRYLLQQRVERCRLDLANPQFRTLRVSEIALQSGFNNFAHFSRVFRDALGCAPTEYRAIAFGA